MTHPPSEAAQRLVAAALAISDEDWQLLADGETAPLDVDGPFSAVVDAVRAARTSPAAPRTDPRVAEARDEVCRLSLPTSGADRFTTALDAYADAVRAARTSPAATPASEPWQVTTLRSALENWGRHFDWCATRKGGVATDSPYSCDCGLAKVLEDSHPFAMSKEWCMAMAAKEGDADVTNAAARGRRKETTR